MPSAESKLIIAMLRANPMASLQEAPTPEEMRATFAQFCSLIPVAQDAVIEETTCGGVPAEFVSVPGADSTRVVLYIHGGGWALGSPKTHRGLTAEISRQAGACVLAIDYRLAPEHPYPAALDDCVAAYEALVASGYEPASIAIAGDSAGGSLTACTLLALKERGLPMPGCAVMFSPSTDMSMSSASWRTRRTIDPMLGGAASDDPPDTSTMKIYLGEIDAKTPMASPAYGDLSGLPPLLIHVGTEEVLFDDSVRLDAAARSAGVDSTLHLWNGQVHVHQMFHSSVLEAREALAEAGIFVRAHTGGGGTWGVSEQSRKVIDLMRSNRQGGAPASVEQQRANMESMARGADADVTVQPVDAGRVPAEWIAGPGAVRERVVLYLHGGGYTAGSLVTHRQLAGWIAKASGGRVLLVDYRLGPEHPYPAAVDDAVTAYVWALGQGVAAGGVVIAGDSAGGGLAAATLVELKKRGLPMPAGAALISPWTDLAAASESLTTRAAIDPMIAGATGLKGMASSYLGTADPFAPTASPVYADLAGLPPLLIQVGTQEVLFDDATRLDAAARTAGVDSTIEAWNGQVHVWHAMAWMVPEGREAIDRIGAFVKERTAAS